MTGRDLVVLLGTDHHPFDRLVRWADSWQDAHPDDRVLVQHGHSSAPRRAAGVDFLSPEELRDRLTQADQIVTHGGPGTISDARLAGVYPLVIPRDPNRGEHVDDHQVRFSRWAADRRLIRLAESERELDEMAGLPAALGTDNEESVRRETSVGRVRELVESLGPDPLRSVRRQPRTEGPTVLYVGGSGRSGSTLLECLLATIPGVVALGEVAHLWLRGVQGDELCACGQAFSRCEFWTDVGEKAFGGWSQVDVGHVLTLKDAVDRQRRIPETSRRQPTARLRAQAIEYSEYYRRIFVAAAEVSGAPIVIDSSKVAPTALAYSHHPGIDLRVVHIVRDSRGVAYSWSKSVPRPETRTQEMMPQLTARESTILWLSHNASIAALGYRGVPTTRIRYEDLVDDPAFAVQGIWSDLDLPGQGGLAVMGDNTVTLTGTHSVAGNPMRFRTGKTTLRSDEAWRRGLLPRDRGLVTAMSWPLLQHYGYLRRQK